MLARWALVPENAGVEGGGQYAYPLIAGAVSNCTFVSGVQFAIKCLRSNASSQLS